MVRALFCFLHFRPSRRKCFNVATHYVQQLEIEGNDGEVKTTHEREREGAGACAEKRSEEKKRSSMCYVCVRLNDDDDRRKRAQLVNANL